MENPAGRSWNVRKTWLSGMSPLAADWASALGVELVDGELPQPASPVAAMAPTAMILPPTITYLRRNLMSSFLSVSID